MERMSKRNRSFLVVSSLSPSLRPPNEARCRLLGDGMGAAGTGTLFGLPPRERIGPYEVESSIMANETAIPNDPEHGRLRRTSGLSAQPLFCAL